MKNPLFFLTLGEWIENNLFSILSLLITIISLIVWLVRLEGRLNITSKEVEDMRDTLAAHDHDMRLHVTDADRHVNHMHLRGMEQRINQVDHRIDKMETTMSGRMDKIETTVAQGFEKTMNRLDTLIRRD